MIFFICSDYSARDSLRKLPQEEYDLLRKTIIGLPEKADDWYSDILIDMEGLEKLINIGIKVTIKQVKNTYSPAIKSKEGGWVHDLDQAKNAVHVHIPNIGLMVMDLVRVLQDCCTDELQRHLNMGWRIIAVCPPNGVRRPDYIIGAQKNLLSE